MKSSSVSEWVKEDKELQDLIQDCREFPGDESYRLHLADYILDVVKEEL